MKQNTRNHPWAGFLGGTALVALTIVLQQIIDGVDPARVAGYVASILLGGAVGALINILAGRHQRREGRAARQPQPRKPEHSEAAPWKQEGSEAAPPKQEGSEAAPPQPRVELTSELAALNTVAQTLSTSLELQELLDRALSTTVDVLGFTGGWIGLIDQRTDTLTRCSHTGLPPSFVEHLESNGIDRILCDLITGERAPLNLEDPSNLSICIPPTCIPATDTHALSESGLQSCVGAAIPCRAGLLPASCEAGLLPAVDQDRPLGILYLFDTEPHPTSGTDRTLLAAICQQIGAAVENARLFTDLRQKGARESEVAQTLLDTAAALSTTLQLDKLLERVLDQLQRVVPCDAASIVMLRDASHDDGTNGRADGARTGWMVASRGAERIGSKRFALTEIPSIERVVRERQPLILSDAADSPSLPGGEGAPVAPGMGEDPPIRSWLGVPLISKDNVIGVLVVDSHHPHAYHDGTARLAVALAHQAALAIENSRLYEQTRAQLREATLLHSVTLALSSTLDIQQILPYMARSLCKILNATSVQIYSLNPAGPPRAEGNEAVPFNTKPIEGEAASPNTVTIVADYATSQATEEERHSEVGRFYSLADLPGGTAGLPHRTPSQVQLTAAATDSPNPSESSHSQSVSSSLLVPMVARDHVVGYAHVQDSLGPRTFTRGEIAVAQTLIQPAAIAMENARLFEETNRRVRELRFLHDVSLAAAAGVRLEDMLQAAAEALAAALQGTTVAILLLESEGSRLRLEAGVGYPAELIGNLHLQLGQGITGWVAQHGQPALVPDVRSDPRYYQGTLDTRSELCVPLVVGPWVIGVLNVESPHINAFTDDDRRLLSTLASNLAVLVERARLFEEVETTTAELQQRAQDLEEANVRLQELDRLKDEFLASMSHELRTPLNSIIGFSEVLIDGLLGDIPPEQWECVKNIHDGGEHLLALINDILDLSKIEAGRLTLEPTTFDVPELLAEVAATTAPLVENRSQELTLEQEDRLPPLTADRFRIKQVLLNLIGNACKFTPLEGHITLSCHTHDPASLLFSIADDGIGIKPENMDIIFEEFRQADGSHSREITGTGLGLAISKRLVEMHGGRIWAESQYGHGSTFYFQLALSGPPSTEPEPAGEAAHI